MRVVFNDAKECKRCARAKRKTGWNAICIKAFKDCECSWSMMEMQNNLAAPKHTRKQKQSNIINNSHFEYANFVVLFAVVNSRHFLTSREITRVKLMFITGINVLYKMWNFIRREWQRWGVERREAEKWSDFHIRNPNAILSVEKRDEKKRSDRLIVGCVVFACMSLACFKPKWFAKINWLVVRTQVNMKCWHEPRK